MIEQPIQDDKLYSSIVLFLPVIYRTQNQIHKLSVAVMLSLRTAVHMRERRVVVNRGFMLMFDMSKVIDQMIQLMQQVQKNKITDRC